MSANAHAATPRVKPRVQFIKPLFIVSPFEDLYSGLGFYPVVAKLTVYGHACNAAAIKQDGRRCDDDGGAITC